MRPFNQKSNDIDIDAPGHQTKTWDGLNPPWSDSGSEHKALRQLIERNSKSATKRKHYVLTTIACFVVTLFVALAAYALQTLMPSRLVAVSARSEFETPQTSEEFRNRAETMMQMGRYQDALVDYSCMIKLEHDSERAHEGIALCYLEMGRTYDAVEKLNQILKSNPNSLSAHMLRGESYRALNEYEKARADFSWALRHDKNCVSAYCSMADLLTMEDKPEEALIYLNSAIDRKLDNFETRQRRADILVTLNRFDEAQKDLDTIETMPDKQENFSTLTSRTKVFMGNHNYSQAVPTLDKLISLRPKRVTLYLERAKAHFGLKHYSKAIKDCDHVLALNAKNPDALLIRGDCHNRLEDKLAALHDYQEASINCGKSVEPRLKLADFQMQQMNYASALAVFQDVLTSDKDSREAAIGVQKAKRALAQIAGDTSVKLADAGDSAEHKRFLQQLRTMTFSEVLAAGYNALRENRIDTARIALKRAVQLHPDSIEARKYLIYALIESNNLRLAQAQLDTLRTLGTDIRAESIKLASAFQQQGQTDEVITILENHVRQYKTDVDAIVKLSDALMSANQRDRALQLCQQAMTIVASRRDQERLKQKYLALKNSDSLESNTSSQNAVDTSPLESRGS